MTDYIALLYSKTDTESKYFRWYQQICRRAAARASTRKTAKAALGYTEGHHVVPKCLCEDTTWISDKQNIVYLTAREHYICHWLLTKVIPNNYRLLYAFARMTVDVIGKRNLTSKQHARCRAAAALATSLKPAWNQGLKYKSGPCSDLRRKSIAQARQQTSKIKCPHCDKQVDPGNYKRFHGEKCKYNPNIDPFILEARSAKNRASVLLAITNGNHAPGSPNKEELKCPHCGRTGVNKPNMLKNHFARCKFANAAAASESVIVSSLSSSA